MRARIPVGSVVSGEVSRTWGRLVSGVFGIPMDVAVWDVQRDWTIEMSPERSSVFALVRSANAIAASW